MGDTEAKFEIGIKAIILNSNGEILLLRAGPEEIKYEVQDFWDLPGGRIQPGHGIEETLIREIEEETGFSKEDVEINGIFDAGISKFSRPYGDGRLNLMLIAYKCRLLNTGRQIRLSPEHREYKWTSVSEAKRLLGTKFPKEFIESLDGVI